MTSKPASRKARAMTFAPRSWPSRPGFATTTRIFSLLMELLYAGNAGRSPRSNLLQGWQHFLGEPFDLGFALWPAADDELKSHVLYTDILEFLQGGNQLIGRTDQVLRILGHRLVGDIDRTATAKT